MQVCKAGITWMQDCLFGAENMQVCVTGVRRNAGFGNRVFKEKQLCLKTGLANRFLVLNTCGKLGYKEVLQETSLSCRQRIYA
jgi:hypothetical protein